MSFSVLSTASAANTLTDTATHALTHALTHAQIDTPTNKSPEASDSIVPDLSSRTRTYQLKNGLKLVVRTDHRAPVAMFQIVYRVGSSDETNGHTGLAHMMEHMMFKGTKHLAAGELSKRIAEYGGEENAFTTQDYTAYFQRWPADRLPISFELEADRMQHLRLDASAFEKEQQVVMEERRLRTDDNPEAKTYEQFLAHAYLASNYRQPVIGWMQDIKRLSVQDLRNWYQQWYAPNNATIVVVGDVEPDAVHALAERFFGDIPARTLPTRSSLIENTTLGTREVHITTPAQWPLLLIGFNVPSLVSAEAPWEAHALRLLAGILDEGYSARIETQLVRKQRIAASAGVGYDPFARGDTLFLFSGTPASPDQMDTLKHRYLALLQETANELATPEELTRVKAQIIARLVFAQDSITSQANNISELESIGLPWDTFEQSMNALQNITPEQIRAVAAKYLTPERMTLAQLHPQPAAPSSSSAESVTRTQGASIDAIKQQR